MTEESPVTKIEITKEIPFQGEGDSLQSRLRNVSLRGFPNTRIYKDSQFNILSLTPNEISDNNLHTPQPNVYRPILNRINSLAELFKQKGINIFHLTNAYDYIATNSSGQQTQWTMLPPVVEQFLIPCHQSGGFDYTSLVGEELRATLLENSWELNSEAHSMSHNNPNNTFNLINDGAHRVFAGFERDGITILQISNMTPGFPYYAAPQPWNKIIVHNKMIEDTSIETKVHIVTSPGHKQLYRLFPTGGILSGEVRPAVKGEEYV